MYKHGDYEKMNKELSNCNWDALFETKNVQECYEIFLDKYNETCSKFIPRFKLTSKTKRAPWITNELLKLSRAKKALWYKLKASGGKIRSIELEYKKAKREFEKQSREATRSFEKNLVFDTKNPKRLYTYINSKQKVKPRLNSIISSTGETVTDNESIANILNDHFSSVFVKEDGSDRLPVFNSRTAERIESITITNSTVAKLLSELNPNKSTGSDGVHPHVLKACAQTLANPVNHLPTLPGLRRTSESLVGS
jgi:hypothetical protein